MKLELKFVYVLNETKVDKYVIKKNEVGIIACEDGDNYVVNFSNANYPLKLKKSNVKIFDPLKTGDGFERKICNVCCRLLPVNQFSKNQNGKNNRTVRRPSCNDCRDIIDGVNVPDKIKKEWEKKKPNYVIWECPICKKKTIPGITSKVVLDHNHITGEPRAWICDSCNTGLGRFKDDINLLQRAIDYLKKSE